MNRTIGIILIAVGIFAAAFAFFRHDDEKTLVEIGDVEIKQNNKKPGKNTQVYYLVAAIGILGGGYLLSRDKRS